MRWALWTVPSALYVLNQSWDQHSLQLGVAGLQQILHLRRGGKVEFKLFCMYSAADSLSPGGLELFLSAILSCARSCSVGLDIYAQRLVQTWEALLDCFLPSSFSRNRCSNPFSFPQLRPVSKSVIVIFCPESTDSLINTTPSHFQHFFLSTHWFPISYFPTILPVCLFYILLLYLFLFSVS